MLTAIIGSLVVLATVTANTLWSARRTSIATDEAVSAVSSFYLEAMADRRAKTITNLINNNFDEMEKAVTFIGHEDVDSQDDLRDTIGKVQSLLGLHHFALVDEDDVVYTHYTTYTGGSRHAFLSDDPLDERTISIVSLYGSSKQLCLAIPTSELSIMGKPLKACFVQLDINDIVNLLALHDQGKTHFALYAKTGANLSGTELGPVISNRNFFDAIEDVVPDEVLKEQTQNFAEGRAGNLTITGDQVEETLYYVPIEGTDWEMAVLIRESVIQDQIKDISERNLITSRNQILFTLLAVLALAVVLLLEYKQLSKARLEEERRASKAFRDMANTDALTSVGNKHAYAEREADLDAQIQAGELHELGVVVGDLNGLKLVNDTQGHAAGDQLIRDACDLMCAYFSRETVFRVGGDEFAVLLQGEGYASMVQMVDAFNRKVEANIGAHAVVVSIGYATLEPTDQQVRDVFDRADRMMYDRKKALVQMGAPASR